MMTIHSYVRMLQSPESGIRLVGCERLWAVTESSPEVIFALEKAACDEFPDVARAAQSTLRREVHHDMAVKMGRGSAWVLKAQQRAQNSCAICPHRKGSAAGLRPYRLR